jgi:hypothetical protein
MAGGPDYRLRLFLSVDLAGSTAFKNGPGSRHENGDPFPIWVSAIRHFYREYPLLVRERFRHALVDQEPAPKFGPPPEVWKSIGDELLFCSRLRSHEHLSGCVSAFLSALNIYGRKLDGDGKHMDLKGAGWIAAFPAANVTVTSTELPSPQDYLAEELENRADESPSEYDFLGKDIDSGFRVARHASSDKFVASVELAWLLSEAHRNRFVGCSFGYHGRHILKGVLKDRPYPVISLDTERSPSRREVRSREEALLPMTHLDEIKVRDFCQAFMADEAIEFPVLNRHGADINTNDLPASYLQFQRSAAATLEETTQRGKTEKEAGDAPDDDGVDLPTEVIELANRQVEEISEPDASDGPTAASSQPKPG